MFILHLYLLIEILECFFFSGTVQACATTPTIYQYSEFKNSTKQPYVFFKTNASL